jgi:hypothetical protein
MALGRDIPAMALRLDVGAVAKVSGEGLFFASPGWLGIELTVRRHGFVDVAFIMLLLIDVPAVTANAPDAMAVLARAEKLFEAVRSWREMEHFASGTGYSTSTQYVFVVPDRLIYLTNQGAEGRIIGLKSHYREPGGAWKVTVREKPPKVAFRFPLATEVASATLGTKITEDDRTLQVVTYDDPSGKLHFALWVDVKTGLPRRIFMVGEAHHMVSTLSGYNAPVKVTPP